DQTFCTGKFGWSKALLLLRVAMPETEADWIDKAKEVDCRELRSMVRRAKKGERPGGGTGDGEDGGKGGGGGGLPTLTFRIAAEVDAVGYEEWTQAKRKLQAETGSAMSDEDAVRAMAQLVLSTRPDGSVPGRERVEESIYKVVVEAERADVRANVRADDADEPAPAAEVAAAASDGSVSDAVRERVLARDGHRCKHCGRKGYLHVHHILWEGRGGKGVARNLTSLCSSCHGLVHDGLLFVEGVPGKDLRITPRAGMPAVGGIQVSLTGEPPTIEPVARLLTTDDIPDQIDFAWLRRHADQIGWTQDGSLELKKPRVAARAGVTRHAPCGTALRL
ncbi:MAG: HNH endonuclease signature motif containing protein, partial [Gemmatimonadota bacterium]